MTTIQAQPATTEKTDTDRAKYIDYVRAAVALASTVSSNDRINRDLSFPAERTETAIVRRVENRRKALENFRNAETAFLDGVTA